MTEEEWLQVANPRAMLTAIPRLAPYRGRVVRSRKFRLLAAAVLRADWARLIDEVLRSAVVTAEEFVDGKAGSGAVEAKRAEVAHTAHWLQSPYVEMCYQLLGPQPIEAARRCATGTPMWARNCEIIREVFGNPFRPVAFRPAWRSPAAVGVAHAMYEARDFAHMPVLADALEEAGCENPEVLAHCRGAGPHVRGCWVVDGVLGKG